MTPDRKTVTGWALGTTAILLVPILVLLGVTLATKGDTGDIKAAQTEAAAATAAAQRNGVVSACQGQYARTAAVHDAQIFSAALEAEANPSPENEARVAFEVASREEMERRALGVAELAAKDPDQPFACPPIPERLQEESLDPTNPDPPQ